MNDTWNKAQEWERQWHGNCINSFHEEEKQLVYADKMGLILTPDNKTPYKFDLQGKSILDIGGGAYSLLLKCVNYDLAVVTDPLMEKYPKWVKQRYLCADILALDVSGESLLEHEHSKVFDEAWIYNVLEHTYDPRKIVENAMGLSKIVRIFEWIDTPPNIGHPQTLKEEWLNNWLGGEGKVESINRGGAVGKAYYGVFKGKHYDPTLSN